MSSKSTELPLFSGRQPRGKWPITLVLMLFYTVSASVILFLTTGFLYWMMEKDIERANDHSLADQVEVVRLIVREQPNDEAALRNEIQSEGAARRFAKYYARVLDKSGRVLMETTEMKDLPLPPKIFPPPVPLGRSPEQGVRWQSANGTWFLLIAAWAEEDTADKTSRILQVALDVTGDEVLLIKYRRMLFVVLAAGILCSAIAGAIIARKGMRPLVEITEAAQKITAYHLDERITPARWPRELMALAKAFDEMLARLEASFKRLSQFSADLAHEFRTPITNLRIQSEVALTRSRSAEEYSRVLESGLEEYEKMSRMIDSLLFLARAENAQTVLECSTLQVEKEIKAVADFYEAAAEEAGVSIAIKGGGILEADAALFRRAISNLLANSLNHTAAGGKIIISATENSGVALELSVEDTGCGIAPEHLPKVFDRFYRVDSARSQQGTGLGLAIVKSIMLLHGGTSRIQSEPGKGTRITLNFPASKLSQL